MGLCVLWTSTCEGAASEDEGCGRPDEASRGGAFTAGSGMDGAKESSFAVATFSAFAACCASMRGGNFDLGAGAPGLATPFIASVADALPEALSLTCGPVGASNMAVMLRDGWCGLVSKRLSKRSYS